MVCTACLFIPFPVLNIRIFHLDKSVLMDDIRRTLGVFVSPRTLSLLTIVAVEMQQVASNVNKFRRVFNLDLRLSSAIVI